MNILILTKKFPYPAKDGETIAIMQLLKGLKNAGNSITVLSINTLKHYSVLSKLPAEIKQLADFHAVEVNTNPNVFSASFNLFSHHSYHYSRFYSAAYEKELIALLQQKQFDVVQLEGLYMTLYCQTIRKYSNAKIALRAHNIEYEIWERTVAQLPIGLKRFYLCLQTKRLKKFELQQPGKCDAIVAISEADKQKFETIAPALPKIAILVGVDINNEKQKAKEEPLSVVHLGSMDWLPNQEGVKWFLENCWNDVVKQIPEAKFYLAGRNIPPSFSKMQYPNFIIEGEVTNAKQYLLSKSVVIVPLLSGSGIRVKIIENMGLGKCIVSSTVGAEGIGTTHHQNILIADSPENFSSSLIKALTNNAFRQSVGANAFNFAREHFDNNMLAEKLNSFYNKLIA
jgi:glycosyltransferase involved in cell wall biosynthesis